MAKECGCGGSQAKGASDGMRAPVAHDPSFVTGHLKLMGGRKIPIVSTGLSAADVVAGWLVRWDIGRMRYRVEPGLYAVGSPGPGSPVLVTANYKLTFDHLRRELGGIDAWILVLDTNGINVWCAAGKGTFGTTELVERLAAARLDEVVTHRSLILPQLGATGVSAHEVRAASGYQVRYGPVRARDISAYLAAGRKKDDEMRRVRFRFADRMAISPAEVSHALPVIAGAALLSALLALPFAGPFMTRWLRLLVPLVGSILVGTVVFPALLPVLPFRAFSLNGALLGLLWAGGSALVLRATPLEAGALVLAATPLSAFLAMNFTGSSTFTSQTGAELEVRRGLIPMIVSLVLGLGLQVAARIIVASAR